MKRFVFVVVLVAACLLVFAAPASAYYAPQEKTAYITSFVPYTDAGTTYSWVEWAGPSSPFDFNGRSGPIPHGYNAVVTREWFDNRLGATLIPVEYFNTLSISRSSGRPRLAITTAWRGLPYWSPTYLTGDPGFPDKTWARDWWVPLGKLPAGSYGGWVTQFAPRAFPSWFDFDNWALLPLRSPILNQPADVNWTQDISFTVAP
jgi:hypothetical protein